MGQVPAGREVEPHEGVAWRHQRHERGDVGGRARMRLDVGEFTSEKLGNSFDRKVFRDIDVLAAAVIAPPRQALGIFVGENRALRLQDCLADDVFRRDQLDLVALAAELAPDHVGNLGIGLRERRGEQAPARIGTGSRRISHRFSRVHGLLALHARRGAGAIAYKAATAKLWAKWQPCCPHQVQGDVGWASVGDPQRSTEASVGSRKNSTNLGLFSAEL